MKNKLSLLFYSPIHIGSGQELEPFQYIIDEKRLYTFSFEHFVTCLNREDKQKLILLQRDQKSSVLKDIRNFITHRLTPDLHQETISITPTVATLYKEKFLDEKNALQINPFIKTMETPYIPGSSLKGAIRTAVLNEWAKNFHNWEGNQKGDEFDILKTKFLDKQGKWRPDISKDVFKYLKIPDISLTKNSTIFSKISNFKLDKGELKETNIQIIKEVTLSFSYAQTQNFNTPKPIEFVLDIEVEKMKDRRMITGRRDLTFETIWNSLDFYKKILEQESEKWSGLNKSLEKFYTGFNQYLEKENEKVDTKVLKIGYGSGFDAVTIDKIINPKSKHGKSINLCESIFPMGWVVLHQVKKL